MSDASTTTTQQSIANQIFKVVFAFYFLVTMMVTTILMLTDYRTAEKQVREELDLLYGAAQAGIVDSLRRSDNKQLRFVLDEVVQHPSLLGIKIVAPDGRILAGVGILVNAKEQSVTVNLQGQEVLVGRVMGMFAQTHCLSNRRRKSPTIGRSALVFQYENRLSKCALALYFVSNRSPP